MDLLRTGLAAAVPLYIAEFAALTWERRALAADILTRMCEADGCGFDWVARSMALLAFLPGGVRAHDLDFGVEVPGRPTPGFLANAERLRAAWTARFAA